MTIKEEIIRASAKVGTPGFKPVTCAKAGAALDCTESLIHLLGKASEDVAEIASELTIGILRTDTFMPYIRVFTLIPPDIILFFSSSMFISAFEAGRAFEQNRQDEAKRLLERENKGD